MVNWLCEELASHQVEVDQSDAAGNTPLHLAAKRGNVATVSTLLNHGAQVGLKNEVGLRAYDCSRMAGKADCAEFLLLYETALSMSKDLLEVNGQRDQTMTELTELTAYFK